MSDVLDEEGVEDEDTGLISSNELQAGELGFAFADLGRVDCVAEFGGEEVGFSCGSVEASVDAEST